MHDKISNCVYEDKYRFPDLKTVAIRSRLLKSSFFVKQSMRSIYCADGERIRLARLFFASNNLLCCGRHSCDNETERAVRAYGEFARQSFFCRL